MKYDRSNFDLPKLMPIEHNSFDAWIMVVSYQYTSISYSLWLCQSGICGRSDKNKRGSYSRRPFPSLLSSPPSSSSSKSTTTFDACYAKRVGIFLFGEGDNAMNLIVLYSKKFVNFLIHKFPLSLGSSGSC